MSTQPPSHSSLPSITTKNTPPFVPQQKKKKAHNAIERRYRNNINDRITELKNAVPALLHARVKNPANNTKRSYHTQHDDDDDDEEDCEEYIDGVAIANKLNKATILRKATEYILHLKRTSEDLILENNDLQHLLSQLPGGQEVLGRYRIQKTQREQEIKRQELQHHALEKHQQRKERTAAAAKKRSRHDADEYNTSLDSSESPTPVATRKKTKHNAPAVSPKSSMTNRVFMALFMAISLFSASPLSAGPTSKEQFENHNHISRTADEISYTNSSSPTSYLGSLFPLSDGW